MKESWGAVVNLITARVINESRSWWLDDLDDVIVGSSGGRI